MTGIPRRKRREVPTWALAIALVIIMAFVGVSYAFIAPPPVLDENRCQADLPGLTQVFVDTTDRLSARQVTALKKVVLDALRPMVPGAMLEIGTLGASWNGLWNPSLSVCRPAMSARESDSGATTRHLQHTFDKFIAPRLDAILNSLSNAPPAASSPVYEAIAAQVVEGASLNAKGTRRLVVISDFLEAVPGFAEPRNARLNVKSVDLPNFASIRADLRGVEVQLYVLDRARARWLQTPGHRAFVKAWFAQRGATVAETIVFLPD